MKKPWLFCALLSLLVGTVPGAALMWIAWQENSQCEIHCAELGIDWSYWLSLGAAGWALGFALTMVLGALLLVLSRFLKKP